MRLRLKKELKHFKDNGCLETKRLHLEAHEEAESQNILSICAKDKETGQPVGGVTLHIEEQSCGPIALSGYWIQKNHHGKGYAIEILKSVLVFAFETLDLVCVHTKAPEHNLASQYILQKAGFVKENKETFKARRRT